MNILLVNPINKKSYKNSLRFPLGLSFIYDVLKRQGHKVELLDLAIIDWDRYSLVSVVSKFSHIDVFGLTGLVTEYMNIKEITKNLKDFYPSKMIILGGALGTRMPNEILNNTNVDIVVAGEGEITTAELFRKLESNTDITTVKGVYFKKDNKIVYTGPREYFTELDTIGFPSRDGFNVEAYFSNSPLAMFGCKRTLNIISSRGCPFNCFYCDKVMWGNVCRTRSPLNMVNEIEYLIKTFNIDSVIFHDDTFNIDKRRVEIFCNLLITKNINIKWLAHCRVNNMTLEIAKKMRKSGCRMVGYGIESGNQEILNSMMKGVRLEMASAAIKATWKAKIIPFGYLMIGWFNERKEQVLDTVKFCTKNKIIGDFSFFTPSPYTPAFLKAQKAGMISSSNILEMLSNRGEWHQHKTINLSSMFDDEVIAVKKYAERKLLLSNVFSLTIFMYIRAMGVKNFISEILRRLFSYGLNGLKLRCE